MATDSRLLAKAKKKLEEKRAEREAALDRRTRRVYAKSPRIEEIDMQIRASMLELVGAAFGTGGQPQARDIREKNIALQAERRKELEKAGFDAGYLDDEYMCPVCNDTGYVRAISKSGRYEMCDCLKKLYKAEQKASLSSLLKLGNESFETFNLSYYDGTPARDTGISPRQHMEIVYETCADYARGFGSKSMNLFLNGAPGLGKTFLCACIARVVSDKDCSVVYDTAGSVFSAFEDLKFSKAEDLSDARDEKKRYLECDLLIIDDLGTEMRTEFINEALYEIINTRLITNRKTIVNSNLTIEDMRMRYSEQIMSRLEGEYQVLTLYGDDIRKKRKY